MPARSAIRLWVKLTALVLVALWPLATSHDWLESAGFIHVAAHGEQHDANHDAADGHCCLAPGVVLLKAPVLAAHSWLAELTAAMVAACTASEPASRQWLDHLSTAPPELRRTWQFVERAAPPSRAPEFVA